MRLLRVGADSLLAEVSDTATAMRVYDEALRRQVEAAEVVPAARTVLFAGVPDVARLEAHWPGGRRRRQSDSTGRGQWPGAHRLRRAGLGSLAPLGLSTREVASRTRRAFAWSPLRLLAGSPTAAGWSRCSQCLG
jgi:hypothetical protein